MQQIVLRDEVPMLPVHTATFLPPSPFLPKTPVFAGDPCFQRDRFEKSPTGRLSEELALLLENNDSEHVYDEKTYQKALSLLRQGANPNIAAGRSKVAPLIWATYNNDLHLTKTLLEHNANPNIPGPWGNGGLHWAAYHGNAAMARLLLRHGADPVLPSDGGALPAEMADFHNHGELGTWLYEKAIITHLNRRLPGRMAGSGTAAEVHRPLTVSRRKAPDGGRLEQLQVAVRDTALLPGVIDSLKALPGIKPTGDERVLSLGQRTIQVLEQINA